MIQAEKMATEFMDKCDVPERPGEDEIVCLIQQVAERTREECYNNFIHKKPLQYAFTKDKIISVVPQGHGIEAIRNARWEDEEI
jgi:hypothetical protein